MGIGPPRIYAPYIPQGLSLYTAWRKHFAWRPVKTLSGKIYWLQGIYTRSHIITRNAEYGDIIDVLGSEQ